MKNFFEKPGKKLLDLKNLDPDTLLYRLLPMTLMEIVTKYFRLDVEGAENIPKEGRVLFSPNHSGFSGFDAIILGHEIFKSTNRIPRILVHHLFFLTQLTAIPAQKMGLVEATTKNGIRLLEEDQMIILFPEGEQGNFKPTSKRYRLQEFKRGFVRVALKTKSPIVPTIIIGAEETHINLKQFKFTKYLKGLVLPLPLNIIPLPAKWKIKFLEPIHLPFHPEAADDSELVREIASDIQEKMQKAISHELSQRNFIYL